MLTTLVALVPKVLMSIGMKLLSEKLLEQLILWGFEKLAASTKTKVDDELYAMVKAALEKKTDA